MLLAALLSAQAPIASKPVTIVMLFKHLHEWNGRQVEVSGWAHGCGASVPNLSGKCYITPSYKWRGGRDRLKLVAFPRLTGGSDEDSVIRVVVRGTAEENECPADEICLDRESDLRVEAIESVERRGS